MDTTSGKTISGNSGKSSSAIDKTIEGAHHTVDRIAEAAAPVIDRLAATAHQAVDKLARSAAPAAGWIEGSAHSVSESSVQMYNDARQYVRDHPFVVIGAAIALGLVISQLARRPPSSADE